ncbi:MAG: putative DNA-binding domain-containing protein [Algicola sp.]|nr:putative DNA-binding domain-containing protein [Algicola sp.]
MKTTQQWFVEATAHKNGLRQGLHSAWHKFALSADQLIKPGHLGIPLRLNIYANGYTARLLECMRADYPGLCCLLGDELFDTFARAYIMETPSKSYTLFDLGQGFAAFLLRTKPDVVQLTDEMAAQLLLPIEVARLERSRVEVIRCKGHEAEPPCEAQAHSDLLIMTDCPLKLSDTARLHRFAFEMTDIIHQLDSKNKPNPSPARSCNLVIWRHNFRIQMLQIEDWQYNFLSCCQEQGTLLHSAHSAADKREVPVSEILAKLYVWLPVMLQNGLVRSMVGSGFR